MRWSISRPDVSQQAEKADGNLEEAIRRTLVMSRLDDLVAWSRKNSVWPFNFASGIEKEYLPNMLICLCSSGDTTFEGCPCD
jgi:hypothetical protein